MSGSVVFGYWAGVHFPRPLCLLGVYQQQPVFE